MSKFKKHNYTGLTKTGESYNGLNIHCHQGVHERVFDYIEDNFLKDISILIVASGAGAFDSRLYDAGYTNITSIDINKGNYAYQNDKVKFKCVDLNSEFSNDLNNHFDVIVAIEIIEHIYSTHYFLNNLKQLVKKEGKILITTPNIHSFDSRIFNLATGYPILFLGTPILYEHINPIYYGILHHHCLLLDLEIEDVETIGHYSEMYKQPKKTILKILSLFFTVLTKIHRLIFKTFFKDLSKEASLDILDYGYITFLKISKKK